MLIHIDTKGYTEKPKEHISIIKPRLQSANTITDTDLETLIKYIQRGYSISPAVMDGKGCKAENWKEQRLFILAQSGTVKGVTVRNVVIGYELIEEEVEEPPQYYSYSSRNNNRNYYD